MIINTTVDTPVYRLEEARYLAVVGGDGGVVHTHTHRRRWMRTMVAGCWLLAGDWHYCSASQHTVCFCLSTSNLPPSHFSPVVDHYSVMTSAFPPGNEKRDYILGYLDF